MTGRPIDEADVRESMGHLVDPHSRDAESHVSTMRVVRDLFDERTFRTITRGREGDRGMCQTMQALLYTTSFELEVRAVPSPRPGSNEVVLRVEAAGICGSDLHGV